MSLQKRIQGLFIVSAIMLYQEQSGVEKSARLGPQLAPYQFPGLGPGPISGAEERHCPYGKGNVRTTWMISNFKSLIGKPTDCGLLLIGEKKKNEGIS